MTTKSAAHSLVEVDFPIVLAVEDGIADSSVAHLPALEWRLGNIHWRWNDLDAPAASWVSECGVHGWVYNLGGVLAATPICGVCAQAAA